MLHPYPFPPSSQAIRPQARPTLSVTSVECTSTANAIHPAPLLDALNRPDRELSKAAHRPDAYQVGGSGFDDAMRCFGTFVETNHERKLRCNTRMNNRAETASNHLVTVVSHAFPLESTVGPMSPDEINSGKEREMGNLEHPIDGAIIDLAALRRDLEAEFRADGVICDREAALLTRLTENNRRIGRARALARATELAMKQEGEFTDYTKRQFALAGVRITPIEPDAA